MTFRIDMDDIDQMLKHGVLQPHAAIGAPTAPSIQQAQGAPGLPVSTPAPPDLQKPTRKESNAAGRAEFEMGKPTVTAEPGLPGFYQQKEEQNQYAKEHPWGSPVSAHPGFLGKVGHGLATAGNIAGDIFVPRVAQNIPGTQLNREQQSAENEAGFERASKTQQEQEHVDTERDAELADASLKGPLTQSEIEKNYATISNLLNPQAKTDFEAWQKQNPGKPVEEWLKAQQASKPPSTAQDTARATQLRADMVAGKPISPEDAAWLKGHTQEKTIVPATTAIINAPDKNSARLDKSFQYNQSALDKVRAPIDQLAQRFSRLTDTLNQKSPQADALVAPELLSVMAGGQGSGVRMNEAEIARIVGGRSQWQNLHAAIQHWSTNPADARSVTAEQDKQIRDLIQTVGQKMSAKQKVIEQAQEELLDADDPKEHRRIVADARKQLDQIDSGEPQGHEGKKLYTDAEVQAAAKAHNMRPEEIEKAYKAKGYRKADQ